MSKLKASISVAKLRKHTNLRAKRYNLTRWSSASEMLKCYVALEKILKDIYVEGTDELICSVLENMKNNELCAQSGKLKIVTKYL